MILLYMVLGIKLVVILHVIACECVMRKIADKREEKQLTTIVEFLNEFVKAEKKAAKSLLMFGQVMDEFKVTFKVALHKANEHNDRS